jgi:hypothetical protein
MSQQQIKEFQEEHNQKMIKELNKFFTVYNDLLLSKNRSEKIFLTNPSPEYYSKVIRVIGNYISSVFREEDWENSVINFASENIKINLSVFKGTRYQESVRRFLLSLKSSMDTNIDNEVEKYLNSEDCEFNGMEREVCREFYKRTRNLGKKITDKSFENVSLDLSSTNTISQFGGPLESFNEYIAYISKDDYKVRILDRFDPVLKKIALSKVHSQIFFDDLI